MPGIYLKHGHAYVSMTETPYDNEDVLQALIAQHPEMLADDDAGQGPLLLIRREAAVSDQEDAGGRWSLDHLYVDADGVPTLVEVKRSSDTRGRREVVAQMLDYAANAKTSFSPDRMAAWLEDDAQARGTSAAQTLADTLGVDDAHGFWTTVATNLDAERLRLIFVSDVISPELRRIIEFLNGQMARTEVLAIEVKQYVDDEQRHQTIVPRVIGNTETAKRTKRSASPTAAIDRTSLLATMADVDRDAVEAARALLDWAQERPDLSTHWNRAGNIGLDAGHALLRLWPQGTVEVKVDTLRRVDPEWDDDERVEQLLQRLELVEGVVLTGNRRRWPRTSLAPLANPATARRSSQSSPTSSQHWTSPHERTLGTLNLCVPERTRGDRAADETTGLRQSGNVGLHSRRCGERSQRGCASPPSTACKEIAEGFNHCLAARCADLAYLGASSDTALYPCARNSSSVRLARAVNRSRLRLCGSPSEHNASASSTSESVGRAYPSGVWAGRRAAPHSMDTVGVSTQLRAEPPSADSTAGTIRSPRARGGLVETSARALSNSLAPHSNIEARAFAQTMVGLERVLQVEHVAAAPLRTAHVAEPLTSVLAWASAASFNNVPVQANGHVVGVVENILGDAPDLPMPTHDGTARTGMREEVVPSVVELCGGGPVMVS